MVTIDPNTGLFQKTMFLEHGMLHIYTPDKDSGAYNKNRVYLEIDDTASNGLNKRETEALIENLQQILACGMLDD